MPISLGPCDGCDLKILYAYDLRTSLVLIFNLGCDIWASLVLIFNLGCDLCALYAASIS